MNTRYPIQGSVCFRWISAAGRALAGVGATRDISVSGAFIESRDVPPLDAEVTVSAALLGGANDYLQTRLVGAGTVCRVEMDEELGMGFAVSVVFRTDGASAQ